MEVVVEFALIHELRMFGGCGFKLDCHFEVCLGVDSLIDLSKSPFVEFADDLVVLANFLGNLRHAGSIK